MIAYNREWLDNAALQQDVEHAFQEQCISAEEMQRIHAAYPVGFYSPNPYIRVGLFLLTAVIVLFSLGLFLLIFLRGIDDAWRAMLIFFGLAVYGALELFIKEKKHYRSGVDDGLLWTSAALLTFAFTFETNISPWVNCALIFVIAACFTLRFADMIMSAVAVLAFLSMLFYLYLLTGNIARATAPFVLMAASLLIYLLAQRCSKNEEWRHYAHCCTSAEITSLITLYLSGNYFVVRELSNEMFGLQLLPGQSIPAGWLFWTITIVLPIIYMVLGIQKKDMLLLRTGLLLSAVSSYTVRHYYSIMSIEAVMTLAGLFIIGISYAFIRYLNTPKHGFAYHPVNRDHLFERLQAESLIITESFTPPATTPPATGIKFGGGSGGGGGAEGVW